MIKILVPTFEGEINDEPSVTEPNQVMSLSEIVRRFAVGMDVPFMDGAEYDEGDEDFEDDPTRDPGFDFLDAHIMESELKERSLLSGEDIKQSASNNADDSGKERVNDLSSERQSNSNESASDSNREPSSPE